ncbi:Xylulose-5-phosphate phosphoketolase [Commensalibacter sp. Nvir]|uniref:phosphoketolase family protein n=1 Tax=Commensalibacter sp. Nvir TaxID=3069817 RepID=UPI002D581D3C|nr:Xylulose-5-phosphate phosphoketolase [Commensalibacter sp. Nvir]
MTNSKPLSDKEIESFNKWWQAANYLSIGQIYLMRNPLLREPLKLEHTKPRLLGHWGTTPGLNFIYLHLNRIIRERDLDIMFVAGPGHGAPGVVAATYIEHTYTELFPNITQDEAGLQKLFKQFSFPGGIPSHAAPATPGSIHEGGELGYSLSHSYGAVFDNPDLIVACVIGDGEAETGPLAASWHSNKFVNPKTDGAVLPILHLNGYKIANPTVLARISHEELKSLMIGYGYEPIFVEGDDPNEMHQKLAKALDQAFDNIKSIQKEARKHNKIKRPLWPMIVFRSPKGWTCPKTIDGLRVEGFWRAHQVPFGDLKKPGHLKLLEHWMKSYHPQTLFDKQGKLIPEITSLNPTGLKRMSALPLTNGGSVRRGLMIPDYYHYAVKVTSPGEEVNETTRVLGSFLRDIVKENPDNFLVLSPDENNSNRLNNVLEATERKWNATTYDYDDHLSPYGQVLEILSEHTIEGWLEGYLLTGRHGLFSCYEAFIHIIDSMVNQHAKWMIEAAKIEWRRPISSLNILLTSHVWRQDHNGFSHQDPGFINHVVLKKPEVSRVYLPPDANTLLYVASRCLRSTNRINVIVAGKQPQPQWLNMDAAIKHCLEGLGIWEWASNDKNGEPDVIIACAGDVPTMEALAAVKILNKHLPDLKIRFINVVDLMTLMSDTQHPHGLSDRVFDSLFTIDKPVIFAYHGFPQLIHSLIYKRKSARNFHVHGFREEGTTTTPFDMVVLNNLDRYHIVSNVVNRIPKLFSKTAYIDQMVRDKLVEHRRYITEHGEDMPEILNWKWNT